MTQETPEYLISFNQFSSELNVYVKYPELKESFLIKLRTGIAINDNVCYLSIRQNKIWKRMEKLPTLCLSRPSD